MRNKILCGLSALLIFGGAVACLFTPDASYSEAERRPLAAFPEFTAETLCKGSFMTNFEDYALDSFPLRDWFRGVKSYANQILGKKDHSGLYVENGNAVKMEYVLKEDSVAHAAERFRNVYNRYLQGMNVYLTLVPDKNCFATENRLKMDYEKMINMLQTGFSEATYIDLFPLLSGADYYYTDPHWRQERLLPVAAFLKEKMGVPSNGVWHENTLNNDFKGAYSAQTAFPLKQDTLTVLEQDFMKDCFVYDHQNQRTIPFYDFEKANGRDPYEAYLSGSLSLITVENPNAKSQKELILFRDSFGSSVAPLLADGYRKITLVDIRYIQPAILDQFIEFKDQDVLFLYSTLVINNSETIK